MSGSPFIQIRGRGAVHNPPNRFERLEVVPDGDFLDELGLEERTVPTVYLKDPARTLIVSNDSPDVGFDHSINVYRGCEHGCAWCFARPTHEFLGFSAGLDFETRILVKEEAPELLRRELASPRWRPAPLGMSGVTDPYQPVERKLRLTRRCVEVLAEARNPVVVITKNHLVARDADLYAELARHDAAAVFLSVTSLDHGLQRVMEPRTSAPRLRLQAIRRLADAGVPVGALIGPVIPGLTDHEIPRILEAAAEAGASYASYVMLRLPHAVKELFSAWLERHYPDRRERVLHRVSETHGGKLYDSRFHLRGRGQGVYAEQIGTLFAVSARKAGLRSGLVPLSTASFRPPVLDGQQLSLL